MTDDDKQKSGVSSMSAFKARRGLRRLLDEYAASLPPPSSRFPYLIFLYPEDLAVDSRHLLFEQLNRRAHKFGQTLVITDVGFDRGGFYVNFDEIGSCDKDPDYDDLIDNWNAALK
ncbi:hypothetical protein [Marinobacter xiaoshiensis]|uniref:Uncharacterized protein n=1 Tax=Marinobacter xiaoshiensis TaxID=3073652 RepID=A0ABU2HJE7_9GAMM|nr:hypothetical protein [Marinobacter sp. F60267]MDS1310736.1 hypothetical protein [Marinobacter sp. F60267]